MKKKHPVLFDYSAVEARQPRRSASIGPAPTTTEDDVQTWLSTEIEAAGDADDVIEAYRRARESVIRIQRASKKKKAAK